MKRKLSLLAVLAICAAVVATGTLAYFTAEDTAHNVITTGGVGIKLVEKIPDGDDPDEGLDDFKDVDGVMPGTNEYKIVTVHNTEEQPAWVRVWVNTAISESGDPISNPTIKCLPLTIEINGESVNVVEYMVEENGKFVKLADSQNWADNWTQGEDGYYYYNRPVEPGQATEPLFEVVHFAKEMGNEYQNCKVYIDVAAEAVQTANNPIPEDGDVTDVKGWPET